MKVEHFEVAMGNKTRFSSYWQHKIMQWICFCLSVCLQQIIVTLTKILVKLLWWEFFPRQIKGNKSCQKLCVVHQNYMQVHKLKDSHLPGVEAKGSIILMVGVSELWYCRKTTQSMWIPFKDINFPPSTQWLTFLQSVNQQVVGLTSHACLNHTTVSWSFSILK